MNYWRYLATVSFIVILGAVIIWLVSDDEPVKSVDHSPKTIKLPDTVSNRQDIQTIDKASSDAMPAKSKDQQPRGTTPEEYKKRVERVVKKINPRIQFYGIVLDQSGQPLSGVIVKYEVLRLGMDMLGRDERKRGRVTSKSDGRFKITPGKGYKLFLEKVYKPGYVFDFKTAFSYGQFYKTELVFSPDKNRPVVIRAIKRNVAERVSHDSGLSGLVVASDASGSISTAIPIPGATDDLKIRIKREVDQKNPLYIGNWAYLINSSGGIQLAEILSNSAPADGYKGASGRRFIKDKGWYTTIPKATYYFRTSSGLYGKLAITVRAAYKNGQSRILYKYWINHNGGRTLFHDRQRRLGDKLYPPVNKHNGFIIHTLSY